MQLQATEVKKNNTNNDINELEEKGKKLSIEDSNAMDVEKPSSEIKQRERSSSFEKKSHELIKRTSSFIRSGSTTVISKATSEKEPEAVFISSIPTINSSLPEAIEKHSINAVNDVKREKMRKRSFSLNKNTNISKKENATNNSNNNNTNNNGTQIKQPTCESLISTGFAFLTEDIVASMSPRSRMELYRALKNTTKKQKQYNEKQSLLTNHSETPQKPTELFSRAERGIEYIKTFQTRLRTEQLLSLIEKNEDNFWGQFFLAGEIIIPCTDLFSLISTQVEISRNETSPRNKILLYQMFCANWLEINKGSVLVAQAQPYIEKIIEFTSIYPEESSIKKQSMKLKGYLERFLIELPATTTIVKSLSPSYKDFTAIMKPILSGEEKASTYKKAVKMIANDLMCRHSELYCHIASKDFFPKQYDPRPTSLTNYATNLNLLSDYVVDTILCENDFKKRVTLIRFFLDVGMECLHLNDYTSSAAIGMALWNGAFNKIPNTLKAVKEHKSCQSALDKFDALFGGMNNHRNLRDCIDELVSHDKQHIPYLGFYLKDITAIQEKGGITSPKDEDPMYDIDALCTLSTTIKKALKSQTHWHNPMMLGTSYSSNFVTHYLANHTAMTEENRYKAAESHSESLKSVENK